MIPCNPHPPGQRARQLRQQTLILAWIVLAAGRMAVSAAAAPPLRSILQRSYATQTRSRITGRSAHASQGRATQVSSGSNPAPSTRPQGRQGVEAYADLIERYSAQHGVDPDLVRAVIQAESAGDPKAVSGQGALGLMQLMPSTATELGLQDALDPEQNIASGTRYLRMLLDRYNSVEVALWAYNAGPGNVAAGRLPAQTEDYVPKVLKLRRRFRSRAGH